MKRIFVVIAALILTACGGENHPQQQVYQQPAQQMQYQQQAMAQPMVAPQPQVVYVQQPAAPQAPASNGLGDMLLAGGAGYLAGNMMANNSNSNNRNYDSRYDNRYDSRLPQTVVNKTYVVQQAPKKQNQYRPTTPARSFSSSSKPAFKPVQITKR